MHFYPVGELPPKNPDWFRALREEWGMNVEFPLWFLDSRTDPSASAALYLEMPPKYTLFRHGHPCERFEVVIQGALQVGDGRWATPGDVFTAKAGEIYGPHTTGPEGATTIEIFCAVEGMFRVLYEDADGNVVEADARKGEIPPDYVPLPAFEA